MGGQNAPWHYAAQNGHNSVDRTVADNQPMVWQFRLRRGVYYVQQCLQPVQTVRRAPRKPLAMKVQNPTAGAKPACTDQKKAEDQNPT